LAYTPAADEMGVHLGFATVVPAGAFHGAIIDNVMLTTAVPEPGPLALMTAGLAALAFVARRRRA
jgi:hypothetical protein